MTHVYRIQDAGGRGPWKPGLSSSWMDEDIGDRASLRPITFPRGSLRHGESVGYACRTIPQLQRWITKTEYARLRAMGYSAVRICAARVIADDGNQVLFAHRRRLAEAAIEFDLYPEET